MDKSNEFSLTIPKTTFFLRNNGDKQGSTVLYCRITYKGTKTEFSLSEKIQRKNWDQRKQQFTGVSEKSKFISTLTETVMFKIKSVAIMGDFETARDLLATLHKGNIKAVYVTDLVKEYIDSQAKLIKEGTLTNHKIKLENLRAFEKHLCYRLTPKSFTVVIGEQFKIWFCKSRETDNISTAYRNVSFYRKAMLYALSKGSIEECALIHFKGERDRRKPVVFLSSREVNMMKHKQFESKLLTQVRDLFLFQCFTGLSYGDIWSEWNIETTEVGTILKGKRVKNDQSFVVPLSDEAQIILMRYAYKLPKYNNAVYNRILKELTGICNIPKRISTHTARKTFATIQDSLGWSRESISKMLGHRSMKTTESYYLGDSDARVMNEMLQRKGF